MQNNKLCGWLCLDKPEGISSNFAMIKVRKLLKELCGYVGTLDPFATGVLPIAVGECRKFIPYVEEAQKIYEFTVVFGKTTDTLDRCGKITEEKQTILKISEIESVLSEFLGEIQQVPPLYSAIKFNGRRACELAREGKNLELKPRKIKIFSLELLKFSSPNKASFRVECSKGTYVRSVARDIAEKLGTIAYVDELRRLKSGFFSINHACTLENLEKIKDNAELAAVLINMESPLDDIPALNVIDEHIAKLRNGLKIQMNPPKISSNVRIFDENSGKFAGIGYLSADGELKAVRMCSY